MLRASLAALLLALPALPALAAAETAVLTRPEKLRESPSAFAFGLADVHRRSSVQVLEVRGEWVRVEIAGSRNGWIRRDSTDLDSRPAQGTEAPLPTPPRRGGSPAALPRSAARASNHALIIDLTAPAPDGRNGADAGNASRIATLMGVPDANTRHVSGEALSLDGLRQALADLDARVGEQDRALIHIAADGARPQGARECGDALLTRDHQLLTATELHRYLQGLAGRADKVFLIIDAGRGDERNPPPGQRNRFSRQTPAGAACGGDVFGNASLPANIQILLASPRNRAAFENENGGLATQALTACFDGQAVTQSDHGLADGDALRRCAQPFLDRMRAGQQLTVAGNSGLIPAPFSWASDPTGADAPRRILEAIHAQRDNRRRLDITPVRAADGTTTVRIASDRPGYLYVLLASENALTLLHPNQHSPDMRLEPGTTVTLPTPDGRKSLAGSRLLFLLTDSARSPQRGGFLPSGVVSATHPDARGLRTATEELLGGDPRPQCRFSETRNLGADQARQCSTGFAARWFPFPAGNAPR